MNEQFSKAKQFSEILDHTFQLCKNYFSKFFLVYLILIGPIYLIEALFLLGSGVGFLRHVGNDMYWIDQFFDGYDVTNVFFLNSFIGLATLFLTPIAVASILIALHKIKNKEEFTVGSAIKQAFSRFFPILGSNLILGLIVVGLFVGFVTALVVFGTIGGIFDHPLSAVLYTIVLIIGFFLGFALLFTRWGFYLATVVFKEGFPGLAQSWRLTKKNTWRVFGLFIVIFLITGIVGVAVEGVVEIILGNSVLYVIIVNLVNILISMINAVAYAVIYFDLKLRQDGDDLREMIDEYQNN